MTQNISPNNKSISFFNKDHIINTDTGSQYWVPMKAKTNIPVNDEPEAVTPTPPVTSTLLIDPAGSSSSLCKVHRIFVGDRVRTSNGATGTVAYMGELHYKPGDYAGIVLDEEIGNCNGSVNGKMYFQCPPRRGIFCLVNTLTIDVGGSVAEQPSRHFHSHPHALMHLTSDIVTNSSTFSTSPSPLRTMSFSPSSLNASQSNATFNDTHVPAPQPAVTSKNVSQVNLPSQVKPTAKDAQPSRGSLTKSGPIVIDSRRPNSSNIPMKPSMTPRTTQAPTSRLPAPRQVANLAKDLPSNASSAEELGSIMPPNNDRLVRPQINKLPPKTMTVTKPAMGTSRVPSKTIPPPKAPVSSTMKPKPLSASAQKPVAQKLVAPATLNKGIRAPTQISTTRAAPPAVKRTIPPKTTSAPSTSAPIRKPAVSAPSSGVKRAIASKPITASATTAKKPPPARPTTNKSMPSIRATSSVSNNKLQRGKTLASQSATTLKSPPASRGDVRGSYASVRSTGKPLRPAPSAVLPPSSKPLSARTPQQKRVAVSLGTVRDPPLLPSSSSLQMSSSELNETDRLFAQRMSKKIGETRDTLTGLRDAIYYKEIQNAATLREIIASLRSQNYLENKRDSYISKLSPKQQELVRQLDECKSNNLQLKMNIHRAEEEIESTKRAANVSKDRVQQLKNQIEIKEKELMVISSDSDMKRNQVLVMKEKCEMLQKQLMALATRNGQATRDLIKQQEELTALPQLSDGLSLQQRKIQCSDLESTIATVRVTLQQHRSALKRVQDNLTETENQLAKEMDSKKKLEETIEGHKVKMREDPRQAEILKIADELREKEEEMETLRSQLNSTREKWATVTNQCEDVTFQSLEETDAIEADTSELLNKKQSELRKCTLAVQTVEKELQDSKERHVLQTSEMAARGQREVLLEQEKLADIQARISSIMLDLSSKRETTASYLSQSQTLKSVELAEELKSIQASKAAIAMAQSEQKELEKENVKIRSTVSDVVKFTDRVRQQVQQLQRENDVKMNSKKQLEEQMSQLQKTRTSLEEECNKKRSECDQLRRSISDILNNRNSNRRSQLTSLWKWAAVEAMKKAREKIESDMKSAEAIMKKDDSQLEELRSSILRTQTDLQIRKDVTKNQSNIEVTIQQQQASLQSLRQKLNTINMEQKNIEASFANVSKQREEINKLDTKILEKDSIYMKELQEECHYSTHRLRELSHKTHKIQQHIRHRSNSSSDPNSPLSPNLSPLTSEMPRNTSISRDSTFTSALDEDDGVEEIIEEEEEELHNEEYHGSMDQVTEKLMSLNQVYLDLIKENDYLTAELESLEEVEVESDDEDSTLPQTKPTPTIARPVVRPSSRPVNSVAPLNHAKPSASSSHAPSRPAALSVHKSPTSKSGFSSPPLSPRGGTAGGKPISPIKKPLR